MKPANLFRLELSSTIGGGRRLVKRLVLPVLLGLPFTLVAMPPHARVAGITMIVLFTAFFGAAVGIVRRRNDGILTRLRLLPIHPALVWADLILASTAIDMIQTLPLLLLHGFVHGVFVDAGYFAGLVGVFALTILFLNILGVLLAHFIESNGEVHLIGALAVGLVAFGSGLMPAPPRLLPLIAFLKPWNPVALLADGLGGLAIPGSTISTVWAILLIPFALLMFFRMWTILPLPGSIALEEVKP